MLGTNPIRKPLQGDGAVLQIQEIFPTIQGEGPATGMPSVFIRLGGCNLACSFCDTEFESFEEMRVEEILRYVSKYDHKYVVITGGEPLRQPIELLCQYLIEAEKTVQLETNGTIYRELHPDVQIVCSPKPTKRGYRKIRSDLLQRITAFKFLISDGITEYRDVPELGQDMLKIPTFLQPIDEYDVVKNKANVERAIALSMKTGYRLSLQMHKILGID